MQCKQLVLAILALAAAGNAARAGGAEEFVKACDSGSDDVTNQCISQIPEDIGLSTGNHACAYHEAEVKCLGLCGNTVTWKVAYQNALKRYRLVCASYINKRLAEKDEEGGAGDGAGDDDSAPRPAKKPADPQPQQPQRSQKPAAVAAAKPKATPAPKPSSSAPSSDKDARTTTSTVRRTTSRPPQTATDRQARTTSLHPQAHAMLPTMDPELDGAPSKMLALRHLPWALAAAAAAAYIA